ncbi:MAG: alanine racemase [Deltaproteobacteria bacterium]|nr:alanine racemase [Deltaproteobacteria bacterium]
MPIQRPTTAKINLQALRRNLQTVRNRIGETREIFAVVKANAYGHGAMEVGRVLQSEGISHFGVATLEEGTELRRNGITGSITILGGLLPDQFEGLFEYDLTPAVYNMEWAERLSRKAVRHRKTIPVQIKVDTGMGRLGFSAGEAPERIAAITDLPGLKIMGVFSHFAFADLDNPECVQAQSAALSRIQKTVGEKGISIPFWHLSNSGAVLAFPSALFNMVRPGIMLYGIAPSEDFSLQEPLAPVLSWETRIIHLKEVPAGTPLSYGHTFVTGRPSRIATLPVGYADGYPRRLSNRAQVLLHGHRAPVVGRVTMDMTLIDVTGIHETALGDRVTLLGKDGGEEITAWELARWNDSIAYEILCGIRRRVPRIYHDPSPDRPV